MRHLILLFSVFVLVLSTHAGESDKQPVEYWSEVLAANDFNEVLSVFQAGPKVEWPTVHSVKYADKEDKTLMAQGVEFRKLGELLAHGLEDYERQLQGISSEQFCERSASLLAMRKQFLRRPSYFNLILVDSINRVLYVNLAERLALSDEVAPCLLSLVERLGSFHPDLISLRSITERELDKVVADESSYLSASSAEQLKMLWSSFGSEATSYQMMPRDLFDLPTYQLMQKQNFPALVNRLVRSDFYMHSLLPALVQYREKDDNYSPTASYQQIQSVLGRETRTPDSLGVVPFGASRASSVVGELLHDIQSGKMRKQLFFSLPEILGGGTQ